MGFLFGLLGIALVIGLPVVALVALTRTSTLQARIERLERRIEELRLEVRRRAEGESRQAAAARTADPAHVGQSGDARATGAPSRSPVPEAVDPMTVPTPAPTPAPTRTPIPTPEPAAANTGPSRWPEQDDYPLEPGWFDLTIERIKGWFTDGNVPVKVGMVVLFAGVAALLKYAADQGWMSFPIQWRLGGIAALALAGLAFGWRQRKQRRTFGLSLQGGAIGVLLMTAFAAFKLYGLLDPGVAFGSWVLLAALTGALAVWQEARALAVLAILAGFLAPVLMSTGAGNHIVLFSFYAVLNAAIFGIAWHRSWRELNLLGFAFTFGIGTFWGIEHYSPEKFDSTWPFLLLFFVFYLALPLLHARRPEEGRPAVEGSLVFGTPLVAFAQLAALIPDDRYVLAGIAVLLGALYAVLCWLQRDGVSLLRNAYLALAVGFVTLAVPLALSAEATASVFALEGAALVWFGLAQSRPLSRLAGAALQGLAAMTLLRVLEGPTGPPVLNAACMGLLLLAFAGFASAWCLQRAGHRNPALGYYLWALAWWTLMGVREVDLYVPATAWGDALLAFAALTAAAAGLALRFTQREALAWTVAIAMAVGIPLAAWQVQHHLHPFADHGLLAWATYAALGAVALHALRRSVSGAAPGLAHSAWLVAWTLAVALWLREICTSSGMPSGWRDAAFALPWLVVAAKLLLLPRLISWPLQQQFVSWRQTLTALWMAALMAIGLALLMVSGDAAPLPWMPLLNPVELLLLGILAVLAFWLYRGEAPDALQSLRAPLLGVGVLLVATSCTLRSVHHLGGVPWDSRLFDTALAQASLSLVWSVLGVAGWIVGSRRRNRELWLTGAVLMAVVLAKLVLVDRGHLGNLPGIASFIGYGLLCTLVGYLAPAPPRLREAEAEA